MKKGFEVLTVLLLSRRTDYSVSKCVILYLGACCLNIILVFINAIMLLNNCHTVQSGLNIFYMDTLTCCHRCTVPAIMHIL